MTRMTENLQSGQQKSMDWIEREYEHIQDKYSERDLSKCYDDNQL